MKRRLMQTFLPLVDRVRGIVISVAGGKTVGIRALVINDQQQVLLVRHTYRDGWHTPGGGVDRGEGIYEALARELREEVGIELTEKPVIFGVYHNIWRGRHDYPILMLVRSFDGVPRVCDPVEIAEVAWFDIDNLPNDVTQKTRIRLAEYKGGQQVHEHW